MNGKGVLKAMDDKTGWPMSCLDDDNSTVFW